MQAGRQLGQQVLEVGGLVQGRDDDAYAGQRRRMVALPRRDVPAPLRRRGRRQASRGVVARRVRGRDDGRTRDPPDARHPWAFVRVHMAPHSNVPHRSWPDSMGPLAGPRCVIFRRLATPLRYPGTRARRCAPVPGSRTKRRGAGRRAPHGAGCDRRHQSACSKTPTTNAPSESALSTRATEYRGKGGFKPLWQYDEV